MTELTGGDRGSPAREGLRRVWANRSEIRDADIVHVELGMTALSTFWLALWASVLRGDLVTVSHDGPLLVGAPGSGVIVTRPGVRDAVAHKVFARFLDRPLRALLRRRTRVWVTLSAESARQLHADGYSPVVPVSLGADAPTADRSPSQCDTVVYAGYISPAKGLDDLLTAWKAIHSQVPLTLTIIGGASRQNEAYASRIRRQFAEIDPTVDWRGWVDDVSLQRDIGSAAIVVLPYRRSNPASGILIRAAVEGRAIVCTNVPAFAGLTHEQSALVVESGNGRNLGDAIKRLALDPHLRDRLGSSAAEVSSRSNTWKEQVAGLESAYQIAAAPRSHDKRRRPKALMISPVYPPARGGIETLSQGIAEGVTALEVSVVTLREPGSADRDHISPVPIQRVRNQPRGGRRSVILLNAAAVWKACFLRPQVVLCMHVRGAYASRILQVLFNVRWLQFYHAKEVVDFEAASRLCIAHADIHLAPSRYSCALLEAAGMTTAAVNLVPPAVRLRAAAPNCLRIPDTLLTVSRLADTNKGHDAVIAALGVIRQVLPSIRWIVVGDGEVAEQLKRGAEAAGVDDLIDWRGQVTDAERDRLFDECDLFVLPSRIPPEGGGEGFGIVYLEAAASGLPSIGIAEGGALDAVSPGYSGLLVQPGDVQGLADAVLSLLGDRARLDHMRETSREWASRFAWESLLKAVEELALAEAASGR